MPGQGNMIDFTVLNSFPLSFSFSVSDSFNKKPVLTDLLCEGEGEKLDSVCDCDREIDRGRAREKEKEREEEKRN